MAQDLEERTSELPEHTSPNKLLFSVLAFGAGITVANLYYNQPLLGAIAERFRASAANTSAIPVATQLGYASGLLLVIPLGDSFERKRLILMTMTGSILALLAVAFSSSLIFLVAASYLLGLISVTPQLIVPYAAAIAPARQRGKIVGIVMSGLLIGVLCSRVVSGFLAAIVGWRGVFVFGSGTVLLLTLLLGAILPRQKPERRVNYLDLLRSLWPILAREKVLRKHALIGACGFGAFSVFWTTLAFYLASRPEHFNSQVTGLFGLVGIAGASIAPIAGRLADRFEARVVNGAALAVVILAFFLMNFAPSSLAWLVLGVFLMDAGVQASQVSNQTRIYSLAPELRNRINSIYMVIYFLGGAIGSALGSLSWSTLNWVGVCATGALMALLGLVFVTTWVP